MNSSELLQFSINVAVFIFMFSIIGKLANIKAFAHNIKEFRLLSPTLVWFATVIIITAEVATIVTLLLGFFVFGMLLAISIMLLFTSAIVSVLVRDIETGCHCFGIRDDPISGYDLVRNLCIIIILVLGLFLSLNMVQIDYPAFTVSVAIVFISLTTSLLLVNMPDILHLFNASSD